MTARPVSVIIVSRGRPDELMTCLAGLDQQTHENFEVVVVADELGTAAVSFAGYEGRVKTCRFDEANISQARNLGLSVAAGSVVAFIDDDAVPEPTWLDRLVAPFDDTSIAASTGFVRGRNGISFQFRGEWVGTDAVSHPLSVSEIEVTVLPPEAGRAIKTMGTNAAFRADRLRALGGFDPAYAFYLDETDVNMRLAIAGASTAIVPLAQVHHGFAASAQRHGSRAPKTLFDIAASTAVFLRKYHGGDEFDRAMLEAFQDQQRRVWRHVKARNIHQSEVEGLLETWAAGVARGREADLGTSDPLSAPAAPYLLFEPRVTKADVVLSGRIWSAQRLRAQARKLVEDGHRVSVFVFSPTPRRHKVRFDPAGYWIQSGGLFGKSDRNQPVISVQPFEARVRREVDRVAPVRRAKQT